MSILSVPKWQDGLVAFRIRYSALLVMSSLILTPNMTPVIARNNRPHIGSVLLNRQTSQQILTGSSIPVQNGDTYGYGECARPRFCTVHPTAEWTSFRSCTPAVGRLNRISILRGSQAPEVYIDPSLIHSISATFSLRFQSCYRFSVTTLRDVRAQHCSASPQPLFCADSEPRRSLRIRACINQCP